MLSLLAQGISLGVSAGAIPGPLTSFLISRTLMQGWRRAIWLIFIPPVSDIPIIILSVLVLRQIPPDFVRVIQVVGGLYLLWLAYGAYKNMRAGVTFKAAEGDAAQRSFWQGVAINWLGPGPYIFWSTILGPLLISALNQSLAHGVALLLGFYGMFAVILALYVIVFDRLRRLDERVVRGIYVVVLIILVLFAVQLIAQGLGVFAS